MTSGERVAIQPIRNPLNGYLLGGIDEATLAAKQQELKDELAEVERILSQAQDLSTTDAQAALAVFDFSQNVAEIWAGSNMLEKREILESVSLNRRLGHLSFVYQRESRSTYLPNGLQSQRVGATRFELATSASRTR